MPTENLAVKDDPSATIAVSADIRSEIQAQGRRMRLWMLAMFIPAWTGT